MKKSGETGKPSDRLRRAVYLAGYQSVIDYGRVTPSSTYGELADALSAISSDSFTPEEIDKAMQSECVSVEDYAYYLRSALVRRLREMMPDGWDSTKSYDP